MKLTDLEPKWWRFEPDGPRVGLTFLCPCCKGTERETHIGVAFHHHGHEAIDDTYIKAHGPSGRDDYIWMLESGEDFHNLTLTPSIDASKSGHWHGFVTNGEIR
jgi:hypothetical protein